MYITPISSFVNVNMKTNSKMKFTQYIGVTQAWMNENINGFRFMNTGDIILLNAYKNLKEKKKKKGIVGPETKRYNYRFYFYSARCYK